MAFGSKENKTPVQVPAHIGIIMDGNGRWAKKRGLPRTAGHTAGALRVFHGKLEPPRRGGLCADEAFSPVPRGSAARLHG